MSPGMVVCDRSRVRYGSGAQPNLETRASRTTNRDVISSTHVQYGSTADLVARWWNGQRDRSARRDIWLTSDGQVWNVRPPAPARAAPVAARWSTTSPGRTKPGR